MAAEKEPKAKKTTKKTSEAAKKTVEPASENIKEKEVSTPVQSTSFSSGDLPFGDKITWVFNNWRQIWDALVLNIVPLIIVVLIPLGLFVATSIAWAASFATGSWTFSDEINLSGVSVLGLMVGFAFLLATIIAAIVLAPAYTIIQLASVRERKVDFSEVWQTSKKFVGRYIVMALLIGLIIGVPILLSALLVFVLIGLILLPLAIIFAILVGFFTALAPYILVDKNLGVQEALRNSYETTKTNWQWVLVAGIVVFAVGFITSLIAGLLGTFVGNIVSTVVSAALSYVLAFIYVKRIARA